MSPPVTDTVQRTPARGPAPARNRRRPPWLRTLGWGATGVLTAFLIAVGTGLIPTEVDPTGTPSTVVEHRVDPTQGCGKPSSYTGHYAIRALRKQGGAAPATGSLILFLRSENEGDPLLPSGTLSLSGGSGNFVGYVTDMHVRGSAIRASVRGGTFQGPVIGTLRGATQGPGRFMATVKATGAGTVSGSFVRVARTSGFAQAQPLP